MRIPIIIAGAACAVLLTVLLLLPPAEEADVMLKEFTVNPSEIGVGETAKLRVVIRNLDFKKHDVKLLFNTSPLVKIRTPDGSMLSRDGTLYYAFTMLPVDEERALVFELMSDLDPNTVSSVRRITLTAVVDGKDIGEEKVAVFTVHS